MCAAAAAAAGACVCGCSLLHAVRNKINSAPQELNIQSLFHQRIESVVKRQPQGIQMLQNFTHKEALTELFQLI